MACNCNYHTWTRVWVMMILCEPPLPLTRTPVANKAVETIIIIITRKEVKSASCNTTYPSTPQVNAKDSR